MVSPLPELQCPLSRAPWSVSVSRGGRREPATPERRDRGAVTAETAVVLPGLLLVVALGLSAVGHVVDVVRATDASRGDDDNAVRSAVLAEVGGVAGAVVQVSRADGRATVLVTFPGDPVLPGLSWAAARWPDVHSRAVAVAEQP
jgi:hypothetical protein